MARNFNRQNVDWKTPTTANGEIQWQHVRVEVLMDIRDQLVELNTTLGCYRVQRMSDDIARIDRRLRAAGYLTTGKRK